MNNLCDECETVSHCLKNGCIPKQPVDPADGSVSRLVFLPSDHPSDTTPFQEQRAFVKGWNGALDVASVAHPDLNRSIHEVAHAVAVRAYEVYLPYDSSELAHDQRVTANDAYAKAYDEVDQRIQEWLRGEPVRVIDPAPPPENCRQRLMANGEAYPKSSCAACGSLSPKWRECDAALNSEVLFNGLTRAETDATASVMGSTTPSTLTARQEGLIADAVTRVLIASGIVNSDVPLTWPLMLMALEGLEKTIQRKPLTDDEIWKNDEIMAANSGYGATFETLREVIRATERAHGIGVV